MRPTPIAVAPPISPRMETLHRYFTRAMQTALFVSILSSLAYIGYFLKNQVSFFHVAGNVLFWVAIGLQVIGGILLYAQLFAPPNRAKKTREYVVLLISFVPFGIVFTFLFILAVYVVRRLLNTDPTKRKAIGKEFGEESQDQLVNISVDLASNVSQNAASSVQPSGGANASSIKQIVNQVAGPTAEQNVSHNSNGLIGAFMLVLVLSTLLSGLFVLSKAAATGQSANNGSSTPKKSGYPSGTIKTFAANGLQPDSMATGADGNIWFASLTASGDSVVGYATPTGSVKEFPIANSLGFSSGSIAVGPDKAIWFTIANNGNCLCTSLGRVTAAGTIQSFRTPEGLGQFGNIHPICALTTGPDGNLWLTEQYSNAIAQVTPNGTVKEFTNSNTNGFPYGITEGPDKNLWFTDRGMIGSITPAGAIQEFPLPSGANAQCITGGKDGALWFTDAGSNQIGRMTTSGTVQEFPLTANSVPSYITTGPDGNLWFIDAGTNAIGRITPNGVVKEYPIAAGTLAGITNGPDGNLWFIYGEIGSSSGVGLLAP